VLKNCDVGVINGFTKVHEDNPHITLDEVIDSVDNATGISKANAYRARKELKNDTKLITPKKKKKRQQISEKHNSFTKSTICKRCMNFFSGLKL
jgi:hypothetical protein